MTTNAEGSVGWQAEILQRYGRKIILVYLNGEARGQIECETQEEVGAWLDLIQSLENTRKHGYKR